MELIIVKNGHIIARSTDPEYTSADSYELRMESNIPEYPETDPGFGKAWVLDYVDGALAWELRDRELTTEEKLQQLDDAVNGLNILGVQ